MPGQAVICTAVCAVAFWIIVDIFVTGLAARLAYYALPLWLWMVAVYGGAFAKRNAATVGAAIVAGLTAMVYVWSLWAVRAASISGYPFDIPL